jgi:hypothetical protein
MSTEEVYKIIYCSRNLIEGDPGERDAEIAKILAVARVNNSRQKITGALLFNSGCFAQVLEGPKPAVEKLLKKIERDPRHGEILILHSGMAKRRDFPDWSMAYAQCGGEDGYTGEAARLEMELLRPVSSGDKVVDLLRLTILELLRTLVIKEQMPPAESIEEPATAV